MIAWWYKNLEVFFLNFKTSKPDDYRFIRLSTLVKEIRTADISIRLYYNWSSDKANIIPIPTPAYIECYLFNYLIIYLSSKQYNDLFNLMVDFIEEVEKLNAGRYNEED